MFDGESGYSSEKTSNEKQFILHNQAVKYVQENLPPSESTIVTPMNNSCEVVVVIPSFNERHHLLRSLISLTEQEGVLPSTFETLVVVNNSEKAETDVLKNNQETLRLLESLHEPVGTPSGNNPAEQAVIDRIRESGIHIYAIDKSSPGKAFTDSAGSVGAARNRGVAEAVARFLNINRNGIIAHNDADARLDKHYIANLIKHFHDDPDLVAIAAKQKVDGEHLDDPEILEASKLLELRSNYEKLLKVHTSGSTESLRKVSSRTFRGAGMATRAYETASVGGVPQLKGGEDGALAHALMAIGKTEISDTLLTYPEVRISERTSMGHGQGLKQIYEMLKKGDEIMVENPDSNNEDIPLLAGSSRLKDILLATYPDIQPHFEEEMSKYLKGKTREDKGETRVATHELRTIKRLLTKNPPSS